MNMYLKSKLVYFTPVLGMSCNMQIPTFLIMGQLEALQLHMNHTHMHTHTHNKKKYHKKIKVQDTARRLPHEDSSL